MRVGSLELHDFRSYQHAKVDFQPGVNLLVGPNGVGKTNIVEAVGYASTLGSHRVAADLPLVAQGAAQAVIRLEIIRSTRSLLTEIAIIPGRANRTQISGSPVRSRDLIGTLRSVLFAPEDLGLVKGDPDARRRFLDEVLIQRAPRYVSVKADYDRVVRQRSALLKSLSANRSSTVRDAAAGTLDVWNEQLIDHGSSLLFGRLSLLEELGPLVAAAYEQVAPGRPASVTYQSKLISESIPELPRDRDALAEIMANQIEDRRSEELARGVTLVGPHRDELRLEINDMLAKSYASHGECWSFALALRLGSFELMRRIDDGAGDPVLILDDVFAELDQSRRDALVAVALGAEQVLVTAAVAHDVPDDLWSTKFTVTPGEVFNGEDA